MTSAAEAVVTAFVAEFDAPTPDVERLVGYFVEDAVYQNMPAQPAVGLDAIRKTLTGFVNRMESGGWEIVNQVAAGDLVMNERLDRYRLPGGEIALPVAGVFRVRESKIVEWRDYFDLATWQRLTAGSSSARL